MIEKKLGGYSIKRLSLILLIVVYIDMITTFIGINIGLYEVNELLSYVSNINIYLIFLFPFLVLFCMIIIHHTFKEWEFELKIGFICYIFISLMASVTNVFWILV